MCSSRRFSKRSRRFLGSRSLPSSEEVLDRLVSSPTPPPPEMLAYRLLYWLPLPFFLLS